MARRFEFRLDTVLRVRRLRAEEAQRRVTAQLVRIARLEELDGELQAELLRRQDALRAGARDVVQPLELARTRAWMAHLRAERTRNAAARAELRRELAGLQEQMRAARVDQRVIEKLREHRFDEYRKAHALREQSESDELARQLHQRAGVSAADELTAAPAARRAAESECA